MFYICTLLRFYFVGQFYSTIYGLLLSQAIRVITYWGNIDFIDLRTWQLLATSCEMSTTRQEIHMHCEFNLRTCCRNPVF